MIVSQPGIYGWYPSSMCSKYYIWFVELGYENLDILEHQDGSWSIIEYYHTPLIPAEARWNYVLMDIRNTIPTPGFVTKYVHQLDLRRKEAWDIAEAKTRAMEEEKVRLNEHAEDTAERAKNIIMQTPALLERIAEKGLREMDLDKIIKHIPRHQLNGHKGVKLL